MYSRTCAFVWAGTLLFIYFVVWARHYDIMQLVMWFIIIVSIGSAHNMTLPYRHNNMSKSGFPAYNL
jgi:hypothetical protein